MFPFLFPRKDKYTTILGSLRARRWRLAGGELLSRLSQAELDPPGERVRATEDAPRDLFRVLERRHSLAEIVNRGARVPVERQRVVPPHLERGFMTLAEGASRHGDHFAHQYLGFFAAIVYNKGIHVVVDCYEGIPMFLAQMPQISLVYVPFDLQCPLIASKPRIRGRKIALRVCLLPREGVATRWCGIATPEPSPRPPPPSRSKKRHSVWNSLFG